MTYISRFCLVALALLIASSRTIAQPTLAPMWSEQVLGTAAAIPVQDGGRIKPLDTFARFKLLQLNGRRSFTDAAGESRTALEWVLDCFFFPDLARDYKIFLIESGEVMQAIGLVSEKQRDRFSAADLAPTRETLSRLAQQYSMKEAPQRTPAQTQLINLAHNLHDFEELCGFMGFARHQFPVEHSSLDSLFNSKKTVSYTEVVGQIPALVQIARTTDSPGSTAVRSLFQHVSNAVGDIPAFALLPPGDDSSLHSEWITPSDVLQMSLNPPYPLEKQIVLLAALESCEANKSNSTAFAQALSDFREKSVAMASARGEYNKIPLEISFYKANLFAYSKYFYVLAFLAASVLWLAPRRRALAWIAGIALAMPFALHVAGIAMRCIIRSRPPVSTLYETILFISAVAVMVCLAIELMNRRRVALSLGAFMGTVGLFLADKYETIERTDTMPSLVAVLDTNFWLSTHVTTVTIGYSAGMLAGAVAHLYILGKAFGIARGAADSYKGLARMTYGIMCFGLLFSTLGTVLGGIWANDSWGRFWGWDPKENGALMIVLCELAILHLRMGGFIKDFGVAMACVFNAIVVGFSWFGVNLLGVGLHSYGFTSGVAKALFIFYCIEAAVLAIGGFVWMREAGVVKVTWQPKPAPPEPAHVSPVDGPH
jgi:ABC-type transport system involved in cytochrome c biogenesis permease subunit